MKTGTKSILFGAHQFILHPLLCAIAWWVLYGFPFDLRLWIAFFVHDLGYWGKEHMDDEEGERHVELGAKIMDKLFGPEWSNMCKYHSRFYSKKNGKPVSRLCVADKYSIVITPEWLYLLLANLSGEINEYKERANKGKYKGENLSGIDDKSWLRSLKLFLWRWVQDNKRNVKP